MEDNCSTSEEYEIIGSESSSPTLTANMISAPESEVPPTTKIAFVEVAKNNIQQPTEPALKIANNGNIEDLENQLQEVMKEKSSSPSPTSSENGRENPSKRVDSKIERPIYIKERHSESSTGEDNPNYHKPTSENEYNSEVGSQTGDYTIFNQVLYLGAASINAPRSENEIQKNMAILNSQTQAQPIEVSVSIPSNSEGFVIVYDATTDSEMVRFKIHNIIFCARGQAGTHESCCFAFTCSHGESEQTTIFQCHVFRCQIPEAVARVLVTFVSAFHRIPPHQLGMQKEVPKSGHREFQFDISLEIKEDDSKGNFTVVPRDKDCFKLRGNIEKQITFTVMPTLSTDSMQDPSESLMIERCFGLLVAYGRKVKHADMNLLEMVSMGNSNGDRRGYITSGIWDPRDPVFVILNKETPKDMRVFMTVAIDLVIRGIQEPVRFIIETKVRVFPQSERFWYYSKKSLTHLFSLKLKQVETSPQGDPQYVVVSVDNLGEVERLRPSTLSLSLNLSSLTSSTLSSISAPGRSPSIASIETPGAEEDSDDDEPLLSGSGEVSKDCPEKELELWRPALLKWQMSPTPTTPKTIASLAKRGIPEALRGEVWQLLAGSFNDMEMMETYRVLITKECHCEQMILRDINRTFPAHDFFKESGGLGQDALYKISRAYSVYDEEVSYCQGTSFLSAALLLHMPEEQAFCVLVKIMFEYGLRDLFKDNFEVLHLRFYQLDRLMEEHVPELWTHFQDQGVESHMFASQWFLTLYTAKFPLFMVFLYLDIFLLLGMDSVFQVALSLLQMSKKELLGADFEGILKYFRVSLPKKYRSEEVAKQMIRLATSIKVKRLKKYEREYLAIKEQEALQEDPRTRLEKENQRLLQDKMRLERENDCLANEYASCKITLRQTIDQLEDRTDYLTKEVKTLESALHEAEEEKRRLTQEAMQVKEMLKKEAEKGDSEAQKNAAIISDYKHICSQLSERLDREQASSARAINDYKHKVAACERCSQLLSPASGSPREGFFEERTPGEELSPQVKELEMELAKTKLALVEAECKNQDLTHKLNQALSELQSNKNTWLHKTLTSISSLKERTASTTGASSSHPNAPVLLGAVAPHPSQPFRVPQSPPPLPTGSEPQMGFVGAVTCGEMSLQH